MLYTIYVELQLDKIPMEKAESMLDEHRNWFKTYFDKGQFLMLGPCPDVPGTGLIIAQANRRDEIDELLTSDVYYAERLAKYTVHEFKAAMFNEDIKNFVG